MVNPAPGTGNFAGIAVYQNADFSGANPPAQTANTLHSNGQLWIGRSTPNAGGTFVDVNTLSSSDGSVLITNSPGNINLQVVNPQPNAYLHEYDDFIGPLNSGGPKYGWANMNLSGIVQSTNGTSTNPGIASMIANAASGGLFLPQSNTSSSQIISPIATGGGVLSVNWVIQLTALSHAGNFYVFSCGLADTTSLTGLSGSFVDGIYFQYTNSVNSGQWTINTTAASATTTVNTTTAAGTSFVNLGFIVNAGGTSVTFTIGGVTVGTITTNIPTDAITPFFFATNEIGTTPVINADLWYMSYSLTTPR